MCKSLQTLNSWHDDDDDDEYYDGDEYDNNGESDNDNECDDDDDNGDNGKKILAVNFKGNICKSRYTMNSCHIVWISEEYRPQQKHVF